MKTGLRQMLLWLLTIFLISSSCLILPVGATPCAILKVSLPEGKYVPYNADHWLSECWLLNLTGGSQTFTLRINNTSSASRSYDTHVIIALNDAGHGNFGTLVVNGITVPKSAFRVGTPRPYNLWNWPCGDVYPTWFDDTCVNVGTIPKKGFVDLVVSVNFSDATGVRMHFDAYGSRVSSPPPNDGYITHNGISEDSTVLLQPGAPPPQLPIASFFYDPYYPETHQLVTFDASESYDPDGYIVSYVWNFGDGTPIVVENDPITDHTYTTYGDCTVKLTVTDNDGLTDEATSLIHISQHPVASFTFSPPDPMVDEIVTFDASASTPDGGNIISYMWDFGDGDVTTVSDPTITHAYLTFGSYTATLTVTDSEGKWDTESKLVTVESAPIADFWWSPYYPQRYEDVTFDASGSTPDGGVIMTYAWNFGDETPIDVKNDPITTHSYAAVGDYTVTLNVTDSEGRWDTESKIITVVARRYQLTVRTSGLGTYFTNVYNETVLLGTATDTTPYTGWFEEDSLILLNIDSPITDGSTRFMFISWSGDASGAGRPVSVTMSTAKDVTANYETQYQITVTASPGGALGGTFKVTYTQSGITHTNVQKITPWIEWVDADTDVSVSEPQNIIDISLGARYKFDRYDPSASVSVNQAKTITLIYKTQYLLTVLTDPVGLSPQPTRNPPGEAGPANCWWYDDTADVTLTAQTVTGYTFNYWDVDGSSRGSGVNPILVLMNAPHTATAHYTIVTPPPSVSINPPSASIRVGQSAHFTSTVSGGTTPYSYQWYLNGNPVSEATSNTWTFTPTTTGTYFVYLKVTDANSNTAQSAPSTVNVGPALPVGGYSISLTKTDLTTQTAAYTALIGLFGFALIITKRKRK